MDLARNTTRSDGRLPRPYLMTTAHTVKACVILKSQAVEVEDDPEAGATPVSRVQKAADACY